MYPMVQLRSALTALLVALVLVAAAACSDGSANSGNPGGGGGGQLFGDNGPIAGDADAGGGAEEVVEDTTPPEEGSFGAPCLENDNCDSSLCVQVPDGKVCSQTCVSDCPKGWYCAEKKGVGGDVIFLCLPKHLYLCDPCNDNGSCNDPGKAGNTCVSFGSAGSFCGTACSEIKPDCPKGYGCQAVVDGKTGLTTHQCVRSEGLCDCSVKAVQLALETTCTNANIYGSCKGARFCSATGLSSCSARVPAEEACNGLDDDCNGQTDDMASSAKCNKTNDFGSCPGKVIACENGKALCDAPDAKPELCNGIDDNCDGQTDEGICDDGNDCSIDTCDTAGGCKHKGQSGVKCSDDGDPCTNDICNEDAQCVHKPVAGIACDDGSVCTQTDKCVAGACIGGNKLGCDDNDPCTTDGCDPFTGCTHTPASDAVCTDDGKVCTNDVCQSGKCVHIDKDGGACDSDGNQCTNDVCSNGQCTHPQAALECNDGNPCTLNDTCSGGACQPGLNNTCDDGKPCTLDKCDPKSGCLHDPQAMDYKTCQAPSGDCPVGVCSGGGCFSKPNEPCQTKVDFDLCTSVKVQGTCSASGKCTANKNQPNQGVQCNGCKTFCLQCSIFKVCFDGFFGF